MENDMLPGQAHETAQADSKPRLAVGFKGKAEIKEEKKEKPTLISEFIPRLNHDADKIAWIVLGTNHIQS